MCSDTGCNEVDENSFDIHFEVKLNTGRRVSFSELWPMIGKSGSALQLSHNLHITASIYSVRIRRQLKSKNPIPYICDCPTEKDQRSKSHATFTHNVRFFEDSKKDEDLSERKFSQFWDAVPLFRPKDPKFSG